MATANLLQTSVSGGTQNALSLQGDGVFFPKASTTSRLALTLTTTDKGFIVYDTTDNNIYFWNGAAWESVPSSGDAGANGSVQYNDNGIVSGATNFVYNKATSAVSVAGDLTVDTSTLKVDSTNNRVGIGTATPSQPLHVKLDQNAYTFSRIDNQNVSSGAYAALMLSASGNSWGIGVGSAAANSNALDFILDAGGANSVKMTLNTAGNLAFPSGKGIDFSAVTGGTGTATANVLNDYEEGIWDASFSSGGGTVTINTAANRCKYTKIGRLVTVNGFLQVSSVSSPTGPLLISNLPFAIPSTTEGDAYSAVSVFPDNLEVTGIGQIVGFGLPSSSSIYLYRYQAGVSIGLAPSAKAGSEFTFTFTYSV